MKNNHLAKVEDLILQIHNTDKMIALHANNPDGAFMLEQYTEIKQRFFKRLIQSLFNLPLSLPQQVYYIRLVSEKMSSNSMLMPTESVQSLEKVIAQM
jgi:hypothetical protein